MKAWSYPIIPGKISTRPRSTRPLGSLPRAFLLAVALAGSGPFGFADSVLASELADIHELDAAALVPTAPRPKIQIGERLVFSGRWLGIPVGSGWIEVQELGSLDGRPAYVIEAQGHSNRVLSAFYPIQDLIRSYLDPETLRPLRFEKHQREGHYRADEVVVFDYERRIAIYHSLLNQSTKEIPIPADTQDIVSAFYWLRTRPFKLTESTTLNVYSDEKIFRMEVKPIKTVRLELFHRGIFPCFMVEPIAAFKGVMVQRGRMWVYVSTDERRVPLLVKLSTPWGLITGLIDAASLRHTPRPAEPSRASENRPPQADGA